MLPETAAKPVGGKVVHLRADPQLVEFLRTLHEAAEKGVLRSIAFVYIVGTDPKIGWHVDGGDAHAIAAGIGDLFHRAHQRRNDNATEET